MRLVAGGFAILVAVFAGTSVRSSAQTQTQVPTDARALYAALQGGGQAQGQPPGAPGRGGQAPRNLQVLPKDWTGQQVQQFMRTYFTTGLGVMCTQCHVQDRASDELKAKVTARKMLQMMMTINDTMLKEIGDPAPAGTYKVTCYTCHRGALKPLTAAPAGGGGL